jgi:hypothetical protein
MKRIAWSHVAVLTAAGLVGALTVTARRAAAELQADANRGRAGAIAWADPEAARLDGELDAGARAVTARIAEKLRLAEALIRGNRTPDDVAARFRELNAGAPGRQDLAEHGPAADPVELAYRQVARFVHSLARVDPARAAAVLKALALEIARRFPAPPRRTGPPGGAP